MATGMKIWLGTAAVVAVVVGAWLMPPAARQRGADPTTTPEEVRARELRREIRRTADIVQKRRWADSLSALAVSSAQQGIAVSGAPGMYAAGALDSIRVRMAEELERAGAQPGRAVVGFFVQPRSFATVQGASRDTRMGSDTYIGEANGQAYCYRVLALARGAISVNNAEIRRYSRTDEDKVSNVLQGCRMVARFGLPGPQVHAWLERGALDFADQPADGPARFEGSWLMPYFSIFGRGAPFRIRTFEWDRCLAGVPDACEIMVLDPLASSSEMEQDFLHMAERSPVSGVGNIISRSPWGSADDYLLSDLRREFGDASFQRFWSSELDVPEAFAAAFGLPLGEWMAAWVGENVGRAAAGPKLTASARSGGLFLIALCGLIAGAWARRRRVA